MGKLEWQALGLGDRQVFQVRKQPGVIFDADSESGVRIETRRTVTELRSPEIFPDVF